VKVSCFRVLGKSDTDLCISLKWLGWIQLELQFEDRAMQFTVSPTHAAIIMQFQEKKR